MKIETLISLLLLALVTGCYTGPELRDPLCQQPVSYRRERLPERMLFDAGEAACADRGGHITQMDGAFDIAAVVEACRAGGNDTPCWTAEPVPVAGEPQVFTVAPFRVVIGGVSPDSTLPLYVICEYPTTD